MIAISHDNIMYYDLDKTTEAERSLHVPKVTNGILALPNGPLAEVDVKIDIWLYRYYGERT